MDTKNIQAIMKMFEESQISKMDLELGELKLTLEKNNEEAIVLTSAPIQKETVVVEEEKQGEAVKSPLVGTFYAASGQGQDPFVKVGDQVNVGDTLCIIEAMKVMNEVKASTSGKILSIEVNDGDSIEFDQVLMMIG